MPVAENACPGRCNQRYRDAWAVYAAAHGRWRLQCALMSERAAALLELVPEDQDLPPSVYDALYAIELPARDDEDEPDAPRRLPDPPEEPGLTCTPGDRVWCLRCRARIRAALVDVGDLAAALEAWSDGHRGAASGERIPTRRTTAPSLSPIGDTLDELYGMIAEVEAQWREHAGHPARPSRARGGDARQRTLNYLLEQLDHILRNRGSVQFGLGIVAWQARLQKISKTDPVVRSRPGRCPRCTWVNVLYAEDGITKCRNCNRWMNEEEYERDVLASGDTAVVEDSRAAREGT